MNAAEVRCVLVPVTGAELLLPNAAIAEVADYCEPEPVADTPDWMPGMLLWRGWQVPMVSFSILAGLASFEDHEGARICYAKSLIGNERMPYFALLTQAFPRLTTVTRASLIETGEDNRPLGVAGTAVVDERTAIIPDLDRLAHLIAHAAFGSLPLSGRTPKPAGPETSA